jgi:GT2 family glycosyltransferase
MQKPKKVSLIIAVYKNIKSLDIILDALEKQTYYPDEIIIAEDAEFPEMKEFLDKKAIPQLVHITQEDLGWRKARSLNNAIQKATGDYLIFIDGDCIPHPRFIEGHIDISEPSFIACGKRAELGEGISTSIYDKKIDMQRLMTSFVSNIIPLHKDGVRHYEEGIYLSSKNPLYALVKNRNVRYIIGCNYSCYKEDFLKINGLDEDYKKPSVGEDIDLGWRFRGLGIQLRSCRNTANVYHLWHKKNFDRSTLKENDAILEKNFAVNRYVCRNGINKLTN